MAMSHREEKLRIREARNMSKERALNRLKKFGHKTMTLTEIKVLQDKVRFSSN